MCACAGEATVLATRGEPGAGEGAGAATSRAIDACAFSCCGAVCFLEPRSNAATLSGSGFDRFLD